jgi:hypothetical protein
LHRPFENVYTLLMVAPGQIQIYELEKRVPVEKVRVYL